MRMNSKLYFDNTYLSYAMDILKSQKKGRRKRIIYPLIDDINNFEIMFKGCSQKAQDFLHEIMKKNWESIVKYTIDDTCLMVFDITLDKEIVIKANIQVFILENCELSEFCTEEDYKQLKEKNKYKVYYYRLDYHPDCIGDIFAEPLPHIHTNVKKIPRFNMSYEKDDFIFTFLENIFINHYYDKWQTWFKNNISDYYLNDFEIMCKKYKENNADEIVQVYSEILEKMKKDIETKKEKYYLWKTDEKFRKTLSYR